MIDGKILANLRDKFFEDNSGITETKTLGSTSPDKYLKNRIEKAFIAGCNAIEEMKNCKALEALLVLAFKTDPEDIMNDPVDLPEDLRKAVENWDIDIDKILSKKSKL